jgi:hypothetical protein
MPKIKLKDGVEEIFFRKVNQTKVSTGYENFVIE